MKKIITLITCLFTFLLASFFANSTTYFVEQGKLKELNKNVIDNIPISTVRELLSKVYAEINKLDKLELLPTNLDNLGDIITAGDMSFKFIKINRTRGGDVYIGLQLSEKNNGQLRASVYVTDTNHGIPEFRTPDIQSVKQKLENVLADKDLLTKSAKTLLENNPYAVVITNSIDDMISRIITPL